MDIVARFYLLIENYSKNRKICTCLDGINSVFHYVSFGVPQGLELGLILFLLYANDLPIVFYFKRIYLPVMQIYVGIAHSGVNIQTL